MKTFLLAGLLFGTPIYANKASDEVTRDDFVQRMEATVGAKKSKSDLTARLLKVAKPVEPEFMQPRVLDEYQDFALNLTEFALKYVSCSNIHTFSDDLAEDGEYGTVLKMDRFVVVRLCPRDDCSNYNEYGCNMGFGDYLINMDDYLQIMSESYFQKYQEYCETCYACMEENDDGAVAANGDDYNAAGDDYYVAGDDYNQAEGDDHNQAEGDDYNQAGGDDYYANEGGDDYVNAATSANACEYSDVCANYEAACKDYSQQASEMEEFFQCGKVNVANDNVYMGPHCRSDGKTIGIGIYKDEECNAYNADLDDISSYTGMDLSDNYLKPFYSDNCISCLASDGYQLEADEENQVTEVCGMLYDESAKCNKYLGNDGDINSYNQEENENMVCNFITNLITNNYDEYGEIYLEADGWQAYIPTVSEMTQFQKYAMSTSILLVLFLLGYSIYLHRTISKHRFTWAPRSRSGFSNDPNTDAARLGRMHSGIIQGRSRSGNDFEVKGGFMA